MVGTIIDVDLAIDPSEAKRTITTIGTNLVQTFATMLTRVGIALVYLLVTGGSTPPRGAVTDELRHLVLTGAPVAGVVSTLIHISLAPLAIPAWLAPTSVIIDKVCTLAIVQARIEGTLIDIFLTEPPSVSWLALAPVTIDLIYTLSLVQTRVGGTFVNIHFTVSSIDPRLTVALVPISIAQFLTSSSILTRINFTLINLSVTKSSSITRIAATSKVINAIHTNSIKTVVASTVIVVPLASAARESTRAVTGEGVE